MRKSPSESESEIADQSYLHVVTPDEDLTPDIDRRYGLARALMATIREPAVFLDRHLHIVAASRSYSQMFPARSSAAPDRPFCEFKSLHWGDLELDLLQNVLSANAVVDDHEVEIDVPNVGRRHMLLNARAATGQANSDVAMLVGLQDVTVSREAEALKIALKEKHEMLLTEVHHRVANSLQIIASILLLKARTVKSDETRLHLHDVHHRLISVATVQRQLSVTGVGNDIELGPYLKVLCEGLASSMIADDQAVAIHSSATGGAIKSEDAVSFGLIVTELVINSLKHGFPGGRSGQIVVAYVKDGADWRLSVSDDGVGRSANSPEPLHVGLGTSIVDALARNLGAQVEIGPPGPGATTTITHTVD